MEHEVMTLSATDSSEAVASGKQLNAFSVEVYQITALPTGVGR